MHTKKHHTREREKKAVTTGEGDHNKSCKDLSSQQIMASSGIFELKKTVVKNMAQQFRSDHIASSATQHATT